MNNKKSNFKRFCETMWIMAKYDVMPWVLAIGFSAAVIYGIKEKTGKTDFDKSVESLFQKQR